MDEEDEEAVALAVAIVVFWYRCERRCRETYRPPYEYVQHSFSLELMHPGRARIWLRFTPEEIYQLVPLLNLEGVPFRNRYKVDSVTAFCVVAARLSFPSRWEQLSDLFGRSKSWLSTVFNDVILYLAARFAPVLLWHPQLTYERLKVFADAVERVGGVPGIWGFVDGTFRGYCRPSGNEEQRRVYSGHKKLWGNNYQAIVTPDGLVSSLSGPYMGPTNDWTMWRRSGCDEAIREVMRGHEKTLYIYGDGAYYASFGVACPFEDPRGRRWLPDDKKAFNKALSSVRIAVEQSFGRTQVLWTYTAFNKGLTAGWQPVAVQFIVAILLTNCHTCLRGTSSAGSRFLVPPPEIEDYLLL
jgi:hypothetical protein